MQIYVSMPSFNISESKDWHGTRAQLDACLCVGCQRVYAFSCLTAGCVCVCVCLFKALFAFQGCCCSVIKRRGTEEDGRQERVKLLFFEERRLLVRDTALIRRAVAVDKRDHMGRSVNSNRPVGTFKVR